MKTPAKLLVVLCVSTLVTTSSLTGQETPSIPNQPTVYSFNCRDASLDVLLDRLQELTEKTITVDLGVQARFTLATTEKVTAAELIEIITQALLDRCIEDAKDIQEKIKTEQGGPGYPPQSVGSPDP